MGPVPLGRLIVSVQPFHVRPFDMEFEETSIRSMLGLRFRDATTERPVADGLQVMVRRKDGRGPPSRAVRTVSGAYVAQQLAGLRSYERVPKDIPDPIPEKDQMDYLVDVRDRRGRFVPVLLEVELPYTPDPERGGLYSIAETPSDIEAEAEDQEAPEPTCYLFSAVRRPVTTGQAVIYADLVARKNGEWQPAAHAVLEVSHKPKNGNSNTPSNNSGAHGNVWYGVADSDGRVAVQIPVPPVQFKTLSEAENEDRGNGESDSGGRRPGTNSSASGERQPLSRLSTYTWPLTVRVRYDPSALTVPEEAGRPLLPSIFTQKTGILYTDPSTTKTTQNVTLTHGTPLVLTTGNLSVLRIAPANDGS